MAAGQTSTLRDLLALEDDPGFLALVCPDTGVLAWPSIRNDTLRMLMSELLYARPIGARRQPSALARAGAAARALAHNAARRPRRSRVIILASGAGLVDQGEGSFNRYTDHFAACLPGDTWLLEGLPGWRWPERARTNPRRSVSAPFEAMALGLARARVRDRHRRVAAELVDLVDRQARSALAWELGADRRDALAMRCARRLAGHALRRRHLERWLRRTGAKLLLTEEGCYGHMAAINATARDHDVVVAEFQHGWVSSGHDAYNVAPSLAAAEAYRRTQPHAFLGYGELGNRLFNAPVERHAIGNPHRESVLAGLARAPGAHREVLVLGDGIDTELYLEFCAELGRRAPARLRVRFRPHPLERERVAALPDPGAGAFAVDTGPDIHPSLAAAHAVVAEVSTGLYDAVGLADRVLVWNTAKSRFGLGEHPFATVDSAADLADKLADPAIGAVSTADADAIWAPGWRARFLGYAGAVLGAD